MKMKRLVILVGAALFLLNTAVGMIFPGYAPLNFLLADLSILLSTGLIFLVANSRSDNGFKIGLGMIFTLTGIARFLFTAFMPERWHANICLTATIGVLIFEILCLCVCMFLSQKSGSR